MKNRGFAIDSSGGALVNVPCEPENNLRLQTYRNVIKMIIFPVIMLGPLKPCCVVVRPALGLSEILPSPTCTFLGLRTWEDTPQGTSSPPSSSWAAGCSASQGLSSRGAGG